LRKQGGNQTQKPQHYKKWLLERKIREVHQGLSQNAIRVS
jgi:hypothetical protein